MGGAKSKRPRNESYVRDQAVDEQHFPTRVYKVGSSAPMETPGQSRPGKRRAQYPPMDDRDQPRLVSKRDRDDQQPQREARRPRAGPVMRAKRGRE